MSNKSNAGNIFLGVLAITTVRDFLEVALEGKILLRSDDPIYSLKNYFLHFNSFYFLVFASLSLVLYLFARKKVAVAECFRVGALAMMLIWIGPLFDYFVCGTFDLFYPRDPLNVVRNLYRLVDPSYDYEGLSRGMRVEIVLAGVGGMGYLWYKTRRVLSSVCGGICLSMTCLVIGLLVPFITQYYEYGFNFGNHPLYDSVLLTQGFVVHGTGCRIALLYLLLCIVLFALAYYLRNRRYFFAFIKNCRWTRAAHYLLLFAAGVMYIYHNPPIPDPSYAPYFEYLTTIWKHPADLLGIFMAAMAVFLSFESAVIFNDIYDYDIDVISNADRPLVTKAIPLSEYRLVGRLFAILALAIAFCINEMFFFLLTLYHFFAFLYSAPPFRLRKYFLVSNVELASIFLLTFHAGTTVLLPEYKFQHIPTYVTFGLLVSYALALTVKDFKDYEGDKKIHIQTLQTLFGKKVGDVVTVAFVCLAILLTPLFLHLKQLLLMGVCFCIVFLLIVWLIKNQRLKEWLVISLYFLYMAIVFCYVIRYTGVYVN